MPLPAQWVYERLISTAFRIWSNARLGSSSEKVTIHVCCNNGRFRVRAGDGRRFMGDRKEFAKQRKNEGCWNGDQSNTMHTQKCAHLEVWIGDLSQSIVYVQQPLCCGCFWLPWKPSLKHPVNGYHKTTNLQWLHRKYFSTILHLCPCRNFIYR